MRKRLMVIFSPRWAQIVSRSNFYRVDGLDYGGVLRLVQVLRSKQYADILFIFALNGLFT